jgi:hypothetical protein
VDEDLALGGVGANVAPEAYDGAIHLDEDHSFSLVLAAFDANRDYLTYAAVTPPAHGTLSGAGPVVTLSVIT